MVRWTSPRNLRTTWPVSGVIHLIHFNLRLPEKYIYTCLAGNLQTGPNEMDTQSMYVHATSEVASKSCHT